MGPLGRFGAGASASAGESRAGFGRGERLASPAVMWCGHDMTWRDMTEYEALPVPAWEGQGAEAVDSTAWVSRGITLHGNTRRCLFVYTRVYTRIRVCVLEWGVDRAFRPDPLQKGLN